MLPLFIASAGGQTISNGLSNIFQQFITYQTSFVALWFVLQGALVSLSYGIGKDERPIISLIVGFCVFAVASVVGGEIFRYL